MWYKLSSDAAYTKAAKTLNTGAAETVCGGDLDTELSYDVKYVLKDKFNTVTVIDYVSTGVKSAFKKFIKENCAMAVNFSKQHNVDCLGIYDKFDRLKHKEWQEYLNSLENKEDYIKDVEFFVNCEVIGAD